MSYVVLDVSGTGEQALHPRTLDETDTTIHCSLCGVEQPGSRR